MEAIRPVFYVSDGTGITAETIGHSLLTQFHGNRFETDRLPFVDSPDKARKAGSWLKKRYRDVFVAVPLEKTAD